MKSFIKRRWSLLSLLLILWISVLSIALISVNHNHGNFVYTLDDAYIHMAIAKNFAQHGVWGVTRYEFTSCSSSLLWTASLASMFFLTGPNVLFAFILNILFGSLSIVLIYILFKREGIKELFAFLALLYLMVASSLIPLMFMGLEHVFHILVSILFVYYSAEVLSGKENGTKESIILIILSLLLPVLRYEGLVLVVVVSLLLVIRKKCLLSFIMILAGLVPVSVFGILSVSKGWSFFPNSVTLKAGFPDIVSFNGFLNFLGSMLSKLFSFPNIFMLVFVFILLLSFLNYFVKNKKSISEIFTRDLIMFFLVVVNVVLYYFYSKSGWSYRYQSFLIALAVFVLFLILSKKLTSSYSIFGSGNKTRIGWIALLIIFVGVLSYYFVLGINAAYNIPQFTTNIYEQQYQTAEFIKRYYQGKEIALTDIGTTSYFADIKLTDLVGLGDIEISKLIRKGEFSTKDALRNIAQKRKLKVAIIFESTFQEDYGSTIPDEWIKVGEWQILNNLICADDVVSVYSIDTLDKKNLINCLKKNYPNFPPTVIQSGLYTQKDY